MKIEPKASYHGKIAVLMIVIFVSALAGCAPTAPVTVNVTEAPKAPNYAGKKVLYVSSYHEGYGLDTKRNPDVEFGQEAGIKAKADIDAFKPDVVIVSDDNAQKYLVVPFLKGTDVPVIFNGVNWDASAYGYPASNVTGMIEVELPDQLIELLKTYAKGERLGYLTVDSETERKVVDIYNLRFFKGQLKPYWVKTQEEFKAAFLAAQDEVDILFIGNNAGSEQWDDAEMKRFVLENSKIPSGSINDWMAPYCLLTVAKSAKEQGVWSAEMALKILDGTPVSAIPVTQNKKGDLILNLDLADKLNVVFAPSLLKNASLILENVASQ